MEFFEFENKNELSKEDFEAQKKFNNWQVFTADQVKLYGFEVGKMIQKSLTNELTLEEVSALKVGKEELAGLKELVITEKVENRIVKSVVFVQEPQVMIIDTLEKSEDGENIKKVKFLDTPLNRKLDRVGFEIIKGKKTKSSIDEDFLKAVQDSPVYKALKEGFEKGMKDSDLIESIKKSFPEVNDEKISSLKKAYGMDKHKEMLQKAKEFEDMYSEEEEDDDTDDKKKKE